MISTTATPEEFNNTRAIDRMPKTGDLIGLNHQEKFGIKHEGHFLVLGEPFTYTKDLDWYEFDLLDIKKQTIRTRTFFKPSFSYCLIKEAEE